MACLLDGLEEEGVIGPGEGPTTAKFMGQRELSEQRIEFAQLPYAIYRVLGD